VVYRNTGTYAEEVMVYTLVWSDVPIVDVPAVPPPATLEFAGAVPNPALSDTRLQFSLAQPGPVRLTLYDLNGRRVRVLADGEFGAGPHALRWDARDEAGQRVGAGLYWARLEAGDRVFTKRITLLR
jgi:hypothetical protein